MSKNQSVRLTEKEADFLGRTGWYHNPKVGNKKFWLTPNEIKKLKEFRQTHKPTRKKYRVERQITPEIKEFIIVKLEDIDNISTITHMVMREFDLDVKERSLHNYIWRLRLKNKTKLKERPKKRLFIDIETGYFICRSWRIGYNLSLDHKSIKEDKEIICICYKWEEEDEVHSVDFRKGEKGMLKKFIKVMDEATEIVGHNIDKFDMKEIRSRCIRLGVPMSPIYRTIDTLKKSRKYFGFASHRLDYIASYLNEESKIPTNFDLWIRAVEDRDNDAIEEMIEYCKNDVLILEDAFHVMSPYIDHNNNHAILKGGEKWECPECTSTNVKFLKSYSTPLGVIRRILTCNECGKEYRVSNHTYTNMLKNINHTDYEKK